MQTLSQIYSPLYGKTLDPANDISIHSGGTEAILCAITAFVEPGDEVVVMEPAFDLLTYIFSCYYQPMTYSQV